jgi:hypothetical protein
MGDRDEWIYIKSVFVQDIFFVVQATEESYKFQEFE